MDTKILLEQCQLVNLQKGKHITILGAGINAPGMIVDKASIAWGNYK